MENEPLGRLVKRLRAERGLTQGQLATYAGVTRSWVSLVESGERKRPDSERLQAIARVLRVPPETLLAAAGYRASRDAVHPLPQPSPVDLIREGLARLEREQVLIVRETISPVSAGGGFAVEAEEWVYVARPGEAGHRFMVVAVDGDCMAPEILPGYRVLVDKDASPRPGDLVVAEHEGEWIVKELQEREGALWLVARRGRPPLKVNGSTRLEGVVRQVMFRPERRPQG